MAKNKLVKGLINVLKVLFSAVAVTFVISKIDSKQLLNVFSDINWLFLIIALLFFAGSKLVSAFRLNIFFSDIGVKLSQISNLKLYLLGMFYNLFLPGGIGGDGYKIWLLGKKGGHSYKKLTAAILIDRINGMIAILIIWLLMVVFIPVQNWYHYLSPIVMIFIIFVYNIIIRRLFVSFKNSVTSTTFHSVIVQLLQIISVIFIALSMGLRDGYTEIVLIFLVSSVAAVLPFTIGGAGAREIVFLYGSKMFGVEATKLVAISFIFFIISAITSLFGVYYSIAKNRVVLERSEKTVITGD